MTQKVLIEKSGKLTVREWLWARIRNQQVFSLQDLILGAPRHFNLEVDKARYYLNGWEKAGYLTSKVTTPPNNQLIRFKTYTLAKDTGANPPLVDPKGNKLTTGLGREQMWRTMRIAGQFTYQQLAAIASTDEIVIAEAEAKSYVSMLHKAGYLKRVKAANNAGGLAVYILKPAAYTGAKPPMIKRQHIVFDQNRHEIVWPKNEDIESEY